MSTNGATTGPGGEEAGSVASPVERGGPPAVDPDRSAREPTAATRALLGVGWVVLYGLVAVAPLVFALLGERPPGRGFWTDLSVGLGFVGLSMLGLQFALTARLGRVSMPYGIDAVIQYHRQISLVAFGFVLAHPAILVFTHERFLDLLNPVTAPWRARFGLLAVVLLVVLVATSIWRVRLGIRYEIWHVGHGVLAVLIVGFALAHVGGVGYYISTTWKQVLWVAMSAALVGLLGYVRIVKPLRMVRHPYRIEEVRPETEDTWSIVLRPDGHPGLRFQAGQFAWLKVGRSAFSAREHPFSFSSSAARPERLEMTVRSSGDFTSQVGTIEPGTRAYLDGPYGVFTSDRNEGPGFVFVAGGIGITPILSMLRTLADRDDPRPLVLVYANPTLDSAAFAAELDALAERLDLLVVHVLEDPPEGWEGETGFVDADVLARALPVSRDRYEYFVCGPPPMMDAVERALRAEGVPLGRIHAEKFDFA